MAAKLITITRPDSELDQRDIIYTTEHRCGASNLMHRIDGRKEAVGKDALLYAVGIHGSSMPMGVPFQVWPTEPCGACNELPILWFQWKKTLIFDIGAKSNG